VLKVQTVNCVAVVHTLVLIKAHSGMLAPRPMCWWVKQVFSESGRSVDLPSSSFVAIIDLSARILCSIKSTFIGVLPASWHDAQSAEEPVSRQAAPSAA